jgi:hypothetical protein
MLAGGGRWPVGELQHEGGEGCFNRHRLASESTPTFG